jgi:hypothetical protein
MNVDMADVKPTFLSWVTVGIMSVTFIVLMKYFTAKYQVPGLTQFFALA